MYRTRLVITGMGAVTPVGIGVNEYWKALITGTSGIGAITRFDSSVAGVSVAAEVKGFLPEDYMPRRLARTLPGFTQYAFAAANEALTESLLPLHTESRRIGLVMATALGGTDVISDTRHAYDMGRRTSPRFVPNTIESSAAASIAIAHGIQGPSFTISTACASGNDALACAAMLLLSNEADAVLVAGGESCICPIVLSSLAAAKALSTDRTEHASRPFDLRRDGFVMGEGGGAIVLETERHAANRGADILAELAGWANVSEAYHITAPRPDGSSAAGCMAKALSRARLLPDNIGYINAHGTGTPIGDKAEARAIRRVFGRYLPPVSSTKSMTGHLMGAGGITEAIACVMALRYGILPPTINLEEPDPDCELNHVPLKACRAVIDASMSNSFGFGGQNSSIVIKRYR